MLLPELTAAAVGLLIFAAMLGGEQRAALARRSARGGSVLLLGACLLALEARGTIFWGSYRIDAFSQFVKMAVAAGFALSVFIARDGAGQRDDARGELFFFLLTSAAGLMAMASAVEALALYVSLEIASFSLFVLVPLRERFPSGKEAGVKFVVIGLMASALMLLGLSILVGLSGTTRLAGMAAAPAVLEAAPAAVIGIALFASGFLFKLALFPFHFWAPDVYEAASHGVASFVATASKVAAVALLGRLFVTFGTGSLPLAGAIALSAAVAMTLGNLVAIGQRDVKRLLAWSAVAQAGYIAIGFVAFSTEGIAAALFYGLLYLLMNAAAFLVVARVGADGSNPSLDSLRGLHRRSPLLALTLLLALFALAGVPPTAGFIGKWLLFRAAMDRGWWWLVLLGAVNSTVSVYYYLVAVKHAYLLKGEDEAPIALTAGDVAMCLGLCAGLVVLGVYPTPLLDWATRAAAALLH
jgi:proton-translocating NADH-quinone oxidoreductase chain N